MKANKLFLFFLLFFHIALRGQETYKVTAYTLNIRNKPTIDSNILGTLNKDYTIDVISIINNWAMFIYRTDTAYVSCKYIEKCNIITDTISANNISNTNFYNIKLKLSEWHLDKEYYTTNSYKVFKIWRLNLNIIPSISFGYSNFNLKNISAKAILGFAADIGVQFKLCDIIKSIPQNYNIESSLGYALKGSRSTSLHYLIFKLSPVGYKHKISEYSISCFLGNYWGLTPSNVRTNKYSFKTKMDYGIYWKIGVNHEKINRLNFNILGEHGLTQVCNSNLKLKNISVYINIAYII